MSAFAYAARDTLFTALLDAAAKHDRSAPGQWQDMKPGAYSYGEIIKMTLALGRLAGKVSKPGEHVGVLMPNMVASVALLIGLSAFRRIPCMLNYTAGVEGMNNACRVAGVRTVITSRVFLDKAGLKEHLGGFNDVQLVYLEDLRKRFTLADKLWLMAYALPFPHLAVPRSEPEAPAVVMFTSGTEGKPKGVVLSHRALLANVAQVMDFLPFKRDDLVFNALPIFHSFGLTAGVLIPMLCGSRLMLYTSPLHFKTIPELVREHGATVLFGTSTFFHHYARHAGDDDFKSLKYVVAGAEKLADSVRETWKNRFGIDILEGYGATETAPVVAVNRPGANRPGTVGQLLTGIEVQTIPVPGITQGGELHVRGPNLLSGYYRFDAPGVLQPAWSELGEGWYDTGDVAELGADGYLSIRGRLKRFAKIAGEMVSLETTEAIARAASPEATHAASVAADPARGEAIILFTTDANLTRDALVAAARTLACPELAVPRRIVTVAELPLLGTGKVDYMRLKEMAAAL